MSACAPTSPTTDPPPALPEESLERLAAYLAGHPAVREKARIDRHWQRAQGASGPIRLGDDCAAIPQPDGSHLLFAAEGMLPSFIRDDPWFAGYSAVMVNLSDVASMGGRPVAITNVVSGAEDETLDAIWAGMRAASENYGVPIVGGHTTPQPGAPATLSAAVLGRAGSKLLTSFDAQPGDLLVIAIDQHGAFRRDQPFWNCSTTTEPARLRRCLEILPALAEDDLCRAAKDISNGGIVGTLAMFCHSSSVGARLDLDPIPRPPEVTLERWLVAFPSFGYLLAVPAEQCDALLARFHAEDVAAAVCGPFERDPAIRLRTGDAEIALPLS